MDYTVEYLERALRRMAEEPPFNDGGLIRRIIFLLRPRDPDDTATAARHLADLLGLVERDPKLAAGLRRHLMHLLQHKQLQDVLMNSGILPRRSFGEELSRRLWFKILPPLADSGGLRDWLDTHLDKADTQWIASVDAQLWERLLHALHFEDCASSERAVLSQAMRDALLGLSHRVASSGLDPDFLHHDPSLQRHVSPFMTQHEEIAAYLRAHFDGQSGPADPAHAQVLISQCEESLERIRRRSHDRGTSVNLTLLSRRIAQQLERMRQLLQIIAAPTAQRVAALVRLYREICVATHERYGVRALLTSSVGRLAYQITQHAGHAGEHYVAENRHELRNIFYSAAGAGVLIAFMALLKIKFAAAHLPALQEALLVSLNYAIGFVVIYMLHFTVATKQPAMTASFLAQSLSQARSASDQHDALQAFVDKVFLSQSLAILGNLLLAFITAALLLSGLMYAGHELVSPEKASHLLEDVSLLHPMNLFYAAIAGVGLFLSGVISGYYDNKALFNEIPARLARLSLPPRLLGAGLWRWFTGYLDGRLGALAGNFFFGLYLGGVSAFGALSGLPLDIRHIAFGAANYAYGLVSHDWQQPWLVIASGALGVLAIGFVNLAVSFSLAFYTALRATRLRHDEARRFLRRAIYGLATAPLRLLFKPRALRNAADSGERRSV
jgi:site-specific recombinase